MPHSGSAVPMIGCRAFDALELRRTTIAAILACVVIGALAQTAQAVPEGGTGTLAAAIGVGRRASRRARPHSKQRVLPGDQHFRALADSSPDAILMHAGGVFVYANRAAVELLRAASADQIIGSPPSAVVAPECRQLAQERTARLQAGQSVPPIEMRWLRFDGSAVDVEASASPRIDAGGVTVHVFVRDITARKDAEAQRLSAESALREQERQLSTLIDNLPGMVYRCRHDPDWTMEFVSDGCLELTGYHPDELTLSRLVSYESITHPADRAHVRKTIGQALAARKRFTVEYRIIDRSGRQKWVQERGLGIYDERDELRFIEGFLTDVDALRSYREQLEHQANHDTLTGLSNRSLLHDRMHQAMAHCARQETTLAVLFLDLDQFKFVNDTLGHSAGDALLCQAAERLRGCLRDGDTVARLGGDEFVLLLIDQPDAAAVGVGAQRILAAMAQPYRLQGKELITTCSIGVALFPADGADVETLLKHADAAMYRAKAQGRNGVHFFTEEINARLSERMSVEHDLRRALQVGEFDLHYQPKVALATGRLIGAEALVRWTHPQHGLLSPARFIPVAEETGLIIPLGEWILRQACVQAREWFAAGLDLQQISVNISARQFRQHDLVEMLAEVLRSTALPPQCLELELTESMMMEHSEELIVKLQALKDLGVQLSVDDFGTGYSSLSYLKRFPVDRLKIDRSFVRDIATDAGDAAIAQAVIRLGQILGLSVTAEGVETEEQLAFLRQHGCDEAQGYYFSPPLPADAFAALWARGLSVSEAAPARYSAFPAIV